MADSSQGSQAPSSNPQNDPLAALAPEIQGVASVWDFGWRAGLQVSQAIGGAVTKNRDRKSLVQAQKSYLGQWGGLASYDGSRIRTPLLKADRFRDYMVETDGKFRPGSASTAQVEWAQFLHALGIEPKMDLIAWKSPRPGSPASSASTSKLEVDGEVMCHIFNIFAEQGKGNLRERSGNVKSDETGGVILPFASIHWNVMKQPSTMTFNLGSDQSISADRVPFGEVGSLMQESTRITKNYFNAIYSQHGCSDSIYTWPDPALSLTLRIQVLYLNVLKVGCLPRIDIYQSRYIDYMEAQKGRASPLPVSYEQYLASEKFDAFSRSGGAQQLARLYVESVRKMSGREKAILLTHRWLDEADRIWRRATVGDGSDFTFVQDVFKAIDTSPELQERFRRSAEAIAKEVARQKARDDAEAEAERLGLSRPQWPWQMEDTAESFDERGLKDEVSFGFFRPGNEGFRIGFKEKVAPIFASPCSHHQSPYESAAKSIVMQVLESYQNQPQNTWKKTLYEARDEVNWLMFTSKYIECDGDVVRFLEYGPESPLWKEVWQLEPRWGE